MIQIGIRRQTAAAARAMATSCLQTSQASKFLKRFQRRSPLFCCHFYRFFTRARQVASPPPAEPVRLRAPVPASERGRAMPVVCEWQVFIGIKSSDCDAIDLFFPSLLVWRKICKNSNLPSDARVAPAATTSSSLSVATHEVESLNLLESRTEFKWRVSLLFSPNLRRVVKTISKANFKSKINLHFPERRFTMRWLARGRRMRVLEGNYWNIMLVACVSLKANKTKLISWPKRIENRRHHRLHCSGSALRRAPSSALGELQGARQLPMVAIRLLARKQLRLTNDHAPRPLPGGR